MKLILINQKNQIMNNIKKLEANIIIFYQIKTIMIVKNYLKKFYIIKLRLNIRINLNAQ